MNHENTSMTFADGDIFDRMKYAEQAMKTINSHSNGACTIAFDASWGVGKSTFIHMWKNEIERGNIDCDQKKKNVKKENLVTQNLEIFPIYYNAWEHDNSDNALLPLLWTVFTTYVDKYGSDISERTPKSRIVTKHLGKLLGAVVSIGASTLTQNGIIANNIGTIINSVIDMASEEFDTSITDKLVAEYEKSNHQKQELHENLNELAKQYSKTIIFIDELDRCKPSFAIETLEAIKHYCDIDNFAFIFAIDLTQLSYSIGTRYGNNMDTGGYLTKFFDHHFRLPIPTSKEMIRMENTKYNFAEQYDMQIGQILDMCSITPREISSVYKAANSLSRSLGFQSNYSPLHAYCMMIILLLICMKKRKPILYNAYISGNNWDDGSLQSRHPKLFKVLSTLEMYRTKTYEECYDMYQKQRLNIQTSNTAEDLCDAVPIVVEQVIEIYTSPYHNTFFKKLECFIESAIL